MMESIMLSIRQMKFHNTASHTDTHRYPDMDLYSSEYQRKAYNRARCYNGSYRW